VKFQTAIERIEAALKRPLPGAAAHERLAPRPRREWPPDFDRARIREAAGLLLVFPTSPRSPSRPRSPNGPTGRSSVSAAAHIVLTVRADTLERHGGQVSLPGGVVDPGETNEQTALREAHEEIGLAISAVRTLGELTPLEIPVSGFRLHPFVAAAAVRPRLTPSAREVAHVLEIDIDRLLDARSVTSRSIMRDGRELTIPAFHIDGFEIWGATAMVLAEFLALLSIAS
jgi:8-oxo-dGTP pyrophosphatase MutT (NUDIX family)